jgi:GDP/UDP-N,N'-diacetylbacillosamine 2-epimerase (hydrolysing)
MMVGNTSSGIIEAASFKIGVINLGDRQKGRYAPENVLHVPFNKEAILVAVKALLNQENNWGVNPYEKSNSAEEIVKILETVFI